MKHLLQVITLVLSMACLASGTENITSGLRFDCAKNGSMLIFGTDAATYGSIYATGTNETSTDTECTSSRHGNEQNVVFEIMGCNTDNKISDVEKEAEKNQSFPIRVIMMHEKQSSTEEEQVIGGKNISFYALTCNNIPIGGFSFQKKSNLTESNKNVTYNQYMEPTLNVMMEVRNNGIPIKNEPVQIGTTLQISISCEVGFNLFLEICFATDVSHVHRKTLLISGSSMDEQLLSNFTDMITPTIAPIASSAPSIPRHSMEATLYAFHFVGSYSIEIVCNITVCQSDDNSCPSNVVSTPVLPAPTTGSSNTGLTPATASTIKSSPPNSARRKRNVVPVGPRTETLRTDIRVVDKFTDNINGMKAYGTSKVPAIWAYMFVLAVSVALTHI